MSLLARLRGAASARGSVAAIHGPDLDLSYAEFIDQVEALAHHLIRERALQPGDRVGYLGFNSVGLLVLVFAAARAGLMVCPLNWRLAKEELAWTIDDASPGLIVSDEHHLGIAERIAGDRPVLTLDEINLFTGGDRLGTMANDPTTPLLLVYTSGATGRPKGAVLTQGALMANARLSWDMHAMAAEDHILTGLPMFHVGGLNIQTIPALLCGAEVTVMDRFEPGACLAAIQAARPTLTVQVPATFQALMAHPDWGATDLGSLRAIATGSTDVPVPIIEAIHARGVPVIQIYGATETGPVVVYQKIEDAHTRIGSIGKAGPGVTVQISGPDGMALPDGEAGEIWLRSPTLASGYWRNEDASRAFSGGWFRTGDVARRDEDGYFWFADRIKNVIISGGENIYPAEIERVLSEMPGIAEAAVVGRPDPKWGAVPVAAVVSRHEISEADIRARFEDKLARFKHPKAIMFVEDLPRNAMGKVVPEKVRELFSP